MNDFNTYIKWIQKQDAKKGLNFWFNYLTGYEGNAIVSPWESIRDSYKKHNVCINTIEETLVKEINACARKLNVTLNTIMEVAWGIVLCKYTKSDDVVFGKVVSGREIPMQGAQSIIGPFINTIPVRINISSNMAISELLKSVQLDDFNGMEYAYCSLADIQKLHNFDGMLINNLYAYENYFVNENKIEELQCGNHS